MKSFRLNLLVRISMDKERRRLQQSGSSHFTAEIEPDRASYWIVTSGMPRADAELREVLTPYAASLAGIRR